jgi:hypothetical protein
LLLLNGTAGVESEKKLPLSISFQDNGANLLDLKNHDFEIQMLNRGFSFAGKSSNKKRIVVSSALPNLQPAVVNIFGCAIFASRSKTETKN